MVTSAIVGISDSDRITAGWERRMTRGTVVGRSGSCDGWCWSGPAWLVSGYYEEIIGENTSRWSRKDQNDDAFQKNGLKMKITGCNFSVLKFLECVKKWTGRLWPNFL